MVEDTDNFGTNDWQALSKKDIKVKAWPAIQGSMWYCVCVINSCSSLLNWTIVDLLILFYVILFSNVSFCILVHDYTPYFIGSPYCSYYNYISEWPYHIVIQYTAHLTRKSALLPLTQDIQKIIAHCSLRRTWAPETGVNNQCKVWSRKPCLDPPGNRLFNLKVKRHANISIGSRYVWGHQRVITVPTHAMGNQFPFKKEVVVLLKLLLYMASYTTPVIHVWCF